MRVRRLIPFVESCYGQQTRRLMHNQKIAIFIQDLQSAWSFRRHLARADLDNISGRNAAGGKHAGRTVHADPALGKHLAQSAIRRTGHKKSLAHPGVNLI